MPAQIIDPALIKAFQPDLTSSAPLQNVNPNLQAKFDQHLHVATSHTDQNGQAKVSLNPQELQIFNNFKQAALNFESNQAKAHQVSFNEEASAKAHKRQNDYEKTAYAPEKMPSSTSIQSFQTGNPLPTETAQTTTLPEPIQAFADTLSEFRQSYKELASGVNSISSKDLGVFTQADVVEAQVKIATMNVYTTIFSNTEASIIGTLKQFLAAQ